MSGQPERPSQTPNRTAQKNDGMAPEEEQHQDVWAELFGIVYSLAETVQTALQAFTPSDDKAVSAITKKRLALRSIHGLKQSQNEIQTLTEHLKALQAASQTWQRSMMYASKSHQELMEQIESTTEELHKTSERLRNVEAQRLAAVREAELLRARTEQQDSVIKEARSSLQHKEEELESLQFSVHELQTSASVTHQNLEVLRQEAAEAEERAKAAIAALDEAKTDAAKAQGLAERHQQVVAKLTADNLVFLMQLKKAEADLAAANQERAQLRLAAEQQRGPWFDQVRAGVEERVRQALQHAQELESRMERREMEHATQMEGMRSQQGQLEEQLSVALQQVQDLQQRLEAASRHQERAESLRDAAEATARELRKELDNLSAENRVLQESLRSMRQECTERWVNEQAALGRVDGLEQRIAELQQALSQQAAVLSGLQRQLDAQAGINRQLMARKEEVEWQLMAAIAKIDGGAADQQVPLNLRVSGLLQVGGPNDQHNSADPALPARAAGTGGLAASAASAAAAAPGGGVAEDRRAAHTAIPVGADARLASGSSETAMAPPHHETQVRGETAFAAVAHAPAAGDDAPRPAFTMAAPAGGTHLSESLPRRVAAAAGGSGTGGGSPPRVPRMNQSTSMTRSDVSLAAEPTLLIAHEELATITHTRGGTATTARLDISDSYPRPPQPQQGSGDDAGAGGGGGAGVGVGSGSGGGGVRGPPARWASLEGASTAVSSPPSSVVLSTEPGSPGEALSLQPSETNRRMPATAAVSIRTVSAGQWLHGGLRGSSDPVGSTGAPDGGQAEGRGVQPTAGQRGLPAPAAPQGVQGQLERRGSLHDGDDVWLPDMPSSSSSNDSDFFFSGSVVIHHESHVGEARHMHTPAQQAQLDQLQQRLQVQLQLSSADLVGGAERQQIGQDAAHGALQLRQPSAYGVQANLGGTHDDDDDERIRVRPALYHAAGGGGVTVRPAVTIRTAPSPSAGAQLPPMGISILSPGHQPRDDRGGDPGGHVFIIVKGGMQREAATRAGGSPLHPALSPKLRAAGAQAASAGSGHSVATPASAATAVAVVSSEVVPAGRTEMLAVVTTAPPVVRGSSAGVAPADTDPVPLREQAGPPFYATGEPLDGGAAAAFMAWALAAGGGGAAASAVPMHPPCKQQQEVPVPASPARSTGSLKSPRSPPHPAMMTVAGKDGSGAADGMGIVARPAIGHPAAGTASTGFRTTAAAQATQPAVAGGQSAPGAMGMLRQPVAATTGAAEGGAAVVITAGMAARPRVSFQGLTDDSSTAADVHGDGSVASAGGGHVRASSISSSSGSLFQASGNGNGGQQPHKPNSMKSVRFSDHEADDDRPHLQRREGAEQRAGLPGALPQRAFSPTDGEGQAARLPASQQQPHVSGETDIPQPYLSRGPVPHPAMLGVSATLSTAANHGLDPVEAAPPKRYSAAGVSTTTIPRTRTG